jgi:hypothetical protein
LEDAVNGRVLYLRSGYRPPPALVVHIGLEGAPRVHVVAATDVDVQRLVGWLDRSLVLDQLPGIVDVVDQVHRGDEDAA